MAGWASRAWTAALAAAPLRLWALFAAGPVATASAAGLVWIVWSGEWPTDLRGKQLDFLGYSLLAVVGINAIIVLTLASARLKGTAPGGVSVEIDAEDDSSKSTKVTVETPAP